MLHLNNGWSGLASDEAPRCGAAIAPDVTADEVYFAQARDRCAACAAIVAAVAARVAAHAAQVSADRGALEARARTLDAKARK